MMIELILYAFSLLGSFSIIQAAAKADFLGGAFSRVFAGSSLSLATTTWLQGYSNVASFTSACINGYVGIGGYVFIFGLFAIAAVWAENLYTHNTLIR
ncbi:MAG TPA: hypothetical protein HPP54_09710 [Nitrospinae bacterium]|nr:hypothetical protein [Nitrospinota bacterium]